LFIAMLDWRTMDLAFCPTWDSCSAVILGSCHFGLAGGRVCQLSIKQPTSSQLTASVKGGEGKEGGREREERERKKGRKGEGGREEWRERKREISALTLQ
jgi:hypothetical protein